MLSALPAHPGSLGQKGSGAAAAAALLPVAPIRDQPTKETSDNAAREDGQLYTTSIFIVVCRMQHTSIFMKCPQRGSRKSRFSRLHILLLSTSPFCHVHWSY